MAGYACIAGRREASVRTSPPRVLVLMGTNAAWCRGILRGFMSVAHERNWTVLHYQASTDLSWLADEWAPGAAIIGPEPGSEEFAALEPATLVSVTTDRTASGIASVVPDEKAIGTLAADHLLATGLTQLTTFRLDESSVAVLREQAFLERAREALAGTPAGWRGHEVLTGRDEDPVKIIEWLRGLPKPCGIFTCTDRWARTVARYARVIGLRVPEDVALVGADNDVLECELISSTLSSVIIPWQEIGRKAAGLVQRALARQAIDGERIVVPSAGVVRRRSSELLVLDDRLVAEAVRWIRANVDRRLSVPMVADAVGVRRQRLERRFRSVLNRTILDEIRRAHVERAKHLLATTDAGLGHIAKRSGFSTPSLLNVAFQHELGMPPGAYRRSVQHESNHPDDD